MPDRITELKTALRAKLDANDEIAQAFKIEEGGGVVVSTEQRDLFRKNLTDAKDIRALIEGEMESKGLRDFEGDLDRVEGGSVANRVAAGAAGGNGGGAQYADAMQMKTLGQLFTESEQFQTLVKSGGYTMREDFKLEGIDLGSMYVGPERGGMERKDVYTTMVAPSTTRGFGTMQRDPLVPRPQRTNRVRDLFPVSPTTANLIDYFRVTGFTNNASPVPERDGSAFGLKPQSSLTFAPAQAPVRTIAHWEAAHRNALADEPQLQAIINNELLYGLRLQEDYQILSGTGTSEDLLGILNTSGIQLYDIGDGPATDNKADAIRRSATKVMLAYYEATGVVVHPYDWEDIELTKDDQGRYLFMMNVAVGMQQTLWRMRVVDTPAITEGTSLVGAFGLGAQLYDREQANIRIAEQHADFFVRNAVVVLAEERLALATKRPEAFVKVALT
jgi:HK97 family phage major capsid protein